MPGTPTFAASADRAIALAGGFSSCAACSVAAGSGTFTRQGVSGGAVPGCRPDWLVGCRNHSKTETRGQNMFDVDELFLIRLIKPVCIILTFILLVWNDRIGHTIEE
jgi:hypothetical protein